MSCFIQKHKAETINSKLIEEPLVSICVQTYQHESYISQCLDSILMQQTNFAFEIILGEDKSLDGTRALCVQYAEKYPDIIRLFLRSRKDVIYVNGNPTGRFNMLENIKSANGKYIAMLEGDDYWSDPLKLQKQVDLLESNKSLIACHHWQKIAKKENGTYLEFEAPKKGHGYFPNSIATVKNIFSNEMRVKTRALMFRNIINEDFFPDWFYKVSFGDVPLSFLLGKHGDFGFIDEEMAVYRITGKGVSTSGLEELGQRKFAVQHFKNWIEIWDRANVFYDYKYEEDVLKTVSYFYEQIIINLKFNLSNLILLLKYNFFERKIPLLMKLNHGKWLILKCFSFSKKRVIKKLKTYKWK